MNEKNLNKGIILDIDKVAKETIINKSYIKEVTSSSTKLVNGFYDPRGLFSSEIFGPERSVGWKTAYGKIVLPLPVIHPAIFYIINRRISYLLKWINLDIGLTEEEDGTLVESNQTNKYKYCGITDLYINTKPILTKLIESGKLNTITAQTICRKLIDRSLPVFTSNVLVIPPIFRPNKEDNNFYIKIIEEISILKSAMSSNDKILVNKILSNIQSIYNMIFEDTINKIKGKTGIVRGSILGRNADFSGRAVIIGDPKIHPRTLGVPRTMLIRLYYPWIINYIQKSKEAQEAMKAAGGYTNIPYLHNLINNDIFDKTIEPAIIDILDKIMRIVIKDKVIIAKRDPVLHKLSVRAFYPVPVEDSSIHISPIVCSGFNADFDGDQMAVFVPLTEKAQKIARESFLATKNMFHPDSTKGLSLSIEKDFVLGVYVITRDEPTNDLPIKLSDDIDIFEYLYKTESFGKMVTYRGKTNTIGRRAAEIIFKDKVNITAPLTEKVLAKELEKFTYDSDLLADIIYEIVQVNSITSTIFGGTMSIKDFKLSDDLIRRRDEVLAHPDKYDVDTELDNITKEYIKRGALTGQLPTQLVTSGARGSAKNIKQISVAKGYISDVNGKTLPTPIGSNFVDGFHPVDYYTSAYGSRKGVIDRVMNTADSGYLLRQMVYLAAPIKSSDLKYCGTKRLVEYFLTDEYMNVLKGRILENGDTLTSDYAKEHNLINKMIRLYSPMYCKSKDMCRCCYPQEYRTKINNATNIGIIAANVVGERSTQLTMQTFHTGGASTILYLSQESPESVNYITQENNNLIAKKKLKIKVLSFENINSEDYNSSQFVILNSSGEDEVSVKFTANIIFFGLVAEAVKIDGDDVILDYDEGTTFGEIAADATDVTSAVKTVQSILNHARDFEDGKQIVGELYETFKVASKIPLIYFEMLVSQLMRDPIKIHYPYRLGSMTQPPKFYGIKTVPALENSTRGIMFERPLETVVNFVLNGANDDIKLKSDLDDLMMI